MQKLKFKSNTITELNNSQIVFIEELRMPKRKQKKKLKQKKLSIPSSEYEMARIQAKEDYFKHYDGTPNVAGWVRWVMRKRCRKPVQIQDQKAV